MKGKCLIPILEIDIHTLCEAAKERLNEVIDRLNRCEKQADNENLWDNYPVIINLLDELIYEELNTFGDNIQPRSKYNYLSRIGRCKEVVCRIQSRLEIKLDIFQNF